MLAVAEAGWASLFLGALYNGPHRPTVHLPFLALALPAVAGVVVAAWGGRRLGPRWRGASWTRVVQPRATDRALRRAIRRHLWWWRSELVALVPVAVVGMAIAAGLISELTIPGSWWRVTTQPWSTVGHHPAVVAGAAWLVSILSWTRGFWLGRVTLTARHALWSLGLAGLVYLGIFIGRATAHSNIFEATTGAAGWLFFVSFPLTAAAIALVHQRDLERAVLARASSRPSGAWVAVLAGPMAGVALISLLLATVVGPAAPAIGRALAWTASAIWSGVRTAAVWLWDLIPRGHAKNAPVKLPGGGNPAHRGRIVRVPQHGTVHIPAVVGELLIIAVILVAAAYLVRYVHFPRLRRPGAAGGEEERDSLFTWRHLLEQVRAALGRLLGRIRGLVRPSRWSRKNRAVVPGTGSGSIGAAGAAGSATVREVYRGLLITSRQAGAPRRSAETSRELAGRLAGDLAFNEHVTERLNHLTRLYEAVRYGDAADGEHEQAAADAGVVIQALRAAQGDAEADGVPHPGPVPGSDG